MSSAPPIYMIGDSLNASGGIASVARSYRDTGLFEQCGIRYLSNYEGPGISRQTRTMVTGILKFLLNGCLGYIKICHIHTASRGSFWRAFLYAKLASALRIPYLLHIHSGEFADFYYHQPSFRRHLIRQTLTKAARVLCLTPGWQNILGNICPDAKFTILGNPVTLPSSGPNNINTQPFQLLYLGRLLEKKGIFDLLQAMPDVLARFPACQLVVAGDGNRAEVKDEITRLGLSKHIELAGWVDGKAKAALLESAALMVQPSHFEAFGVSLLEAMAHGKPIVATDVGGIPEVALHGVHGLLVEPRNPRALAGAITELLADPNRQKLMGRAGYRHVAEHYSSEIINQQLAALYQSLMGLSSPSVVQGEYE